ncbi:MAG: SDR family oxidoreductase [Candidatus Kapaibacteriales bacterium]
MNKKVFVYGATSAIAQEVMKIWAKRGYSMHLVSRSQEKLEAVIGDLKIRNSSVSISHSISDATDYSSHTNAINEGIQEHQRFDIYLIAHGSLPDQESIQNDTSASLKEFEVNATSYISLLTEIASQREKDSGKSTLAVISSVAGERGRKALYLYSAAKAAVTQYLSGLRQRFVEKSNITILTIKPGIINTPMTADLPDSPLATDAPKAAKLIAKAIESGDEVAYIPGFWKPIMSVIKHIPESIFKKLKF